jgi:predicted Zn-dependent peptidase
MKRAALCALLLLATASSPAAQTTLQVPFTQFTLPNGLSVILHEDHSVPIVSVNVWYHVGSAN